MARDGADPLAARKAEKRTTPTFEAAAEQVHEAHTASWSNEKHKKQWIDTLKLYAFPIFGKKQVSTITSADVMQALSPIWTSKAETARRVLQRIKTVMDWAKASGHRAGDNPVEGVTKALPKQTAPRGHHAALGYQKVPAFIGNLQKSDAGESARLAFEFTILTAARTNEALGAKWDEIDTQKKTWTIPATRMKAKQEHRVPLSPRCIAILKRARKLNSESDYVFPGGKNDKPLSNMVFLMLLRRMKVEVTAHGFRSSFRDWASEQTSFPNAVCEAALAHSIKDKVEAAYHRTDLFDKRRELMEEWEIFCSKISTAKKARKKSSP